MSDILTVLGRNSDGDGVAILAKECENGYCLSITSNVHQSVEEFESVADALGSLMAWMGSEGCTFGPVRKVGETNSWS